jgi:hypothetical protein
MLATCVAAITHVDNGISMLGSQADKRVCARSSVPASSQPCSDVRLLWPNATDAGVRVDIDHQQGDRGQL